MEFAIHQHPLWNGKGRLQRANNDPECQAPSPYYISED